MLNPKNNKVAFTITAKNRLPSALICRESFLRHTPYIDFVIFLADMVSSGDDIGLVNIADCVACTELKRLLSFKANNKLEEMAYKYGVVEFCTSVKPFCIEYLLSSGYDKVIYFDPDIFFYAKCYEPFYLLDSYDCVVTPHMTVPYPQDSKNQNDIDILHAGSYNLGFGGWSLSTQTMNFLRWWQGQLVNYCIVDTTQGFFVDQIWMNQAPCFMNTYILKHPSYNVAYWNLHERKVEYLDGKWFAAGEPLVFYHFSGLDYANLDSISKHQNRYFLSNLPHLRPLFTDYVNELKKYDAISNIKLPYYYRTGKNRRLEYSQVFAKTANPFLGDTQRSTCGLNIVGYFPYNVSTAETGRHFVQKIYSTGIPYVLHPITTQQPRINLIEEREFGNYYRKKSSYSTTFSCINLDEIDKVRKAYPQFFSARNIGMFWWEIEDDLPFQENVAAIDEILCCTDFVYNVFKKFAPHKTIHKIPYPFIAPQPGSYNNNKNQCRKLVGLPEDIFIFYFNFNYNSSFERKNPVGILQAFAKAFRPTDKVMLLLKTMGYEAYPTETHMIDSLCRELGIDHQVTVIDGALCKTDMLSLMVLSDAYISLHRSEGCGMNLLDAMYMGKPVIATAYGGNTDFMCEDNSLLVKYKKVSIQNDCAHGYYRAGATWAEPDIGDAASKMRLVFENSQLCQEIGKRANQAIVEYADMHRFNRKLYEILL